MAHPGGIDADYARWKTLVPFLYDWFGHHRLVWPALSCRWGAVLERGEFKHKQRLYLSEQTDGSATHPNTLVVTNVDVVKRRVAAAEHMIFEEESRSPFVKSWKKIIHPGEVNKIREFESQPNLVVTHTDAPELFVWDTDKQPHRKTGPSAADAKDERDRTGAPSKPDLVLVGHEENAEFALAVRRETFDVASGGKDAQVLLWSVADHDNGAVWRTPSDPSPPRRVEAPAWAREAEISTARRRSRLEAPFEDTKTRWRTSRSTPSRNLSCAAWRAIARSSSGTAARGTDPRTGWRRRTRTTYTAWIGAFWTSTRFSPGRRTAR